MKKIFWEKEEKIELDKSFSQNPHPNMATKEFLADKFRVNVQKITNYFKNKRQKLRKNGQSIKRVFRDQKSQKVIKEPAKVTTTLQKSKSISTPLVKSGNEIAMVKSESIEPESDYQDAAAQDSRESTHQSSTFGEFSEPRLEVPKINTNQLIRSIPKMGLSAKPSRDSIRHKYEINQHGPIQSLFPLFSSHRLPQTTINSTYFSVQMPLISSCLDFTTRHYFPINEKPSDDISIGNDENLDAIFEKNLQELDESKDTGSETDSFERVSEQYKEAEIKPHPSWFPFSALHPNQPIYPKTNPFLSY